MPAKLRKEDMIGKIFSTRNYGDYEIIDFSSWGDVTIKFIATGYVKITNKGEINRRSIKDPYYPSIYGVGYCGEGSYPLSYHNEGGKKTNTPAYEVWLGRLKSCYGASKSSHLYRDVSVCTEWHNFQTFAKWYYNQVRLFGKGGNVDKDLLHLGNKLYSPETCVYVPPAINSLFTGASGKISGVHFCNTKSKWVAQIQKGELSESGSKRQTYLGTYLNKEDADKAYYQAKLEHVKQVALKYQDKIHPTLFYKMYHGTENYLNYYMNKE